MEVRAQCKGQGYFLAVCVMLTFTYVTVSGLCGPNNRCTLGRVCKDNKCVCGETYGTKFTTISIGTAYSYYCLETCNNTDSVTTCPNNTKCLQNEFSLGNYFCLCEGQVAPLGDGDCTDTGRCNDQCQYGTVCRNRGCHCRDGYGRINPTYINDTALFSCIQICDPNASNCTSNRKCLVNSQTNNTYNCLCKNGSLPSPIGRCSGDSNETSTAPSPLPTDTESTRNNSVSGVTPTAATVTGPKASSIGLGAGLGGAAVSVAVAVVVVVVVIKRRRKSTKYCAETGQPHQTPEHKVDPGHEDPGPETGEPNPAYHGSVPNNGLRFSDLDRTSAMTAGGGGPQYAEIGPVLPPGVTGDVSGLYSQVDKSKKQNAKQQESFSGMYSNSQIPERKAKQKAEMKSRDKKGLNADGTADLYSVPSLTSNENQGLTGSGNSHREPAHYDTTYSIAAGLRDVAVGLDQKSADQYDVLKLQKISDDTRRDCNA